MARPDDIFTDNWTMTNDRAQAEPHARFADRKVY